MTDTATPANATDHSPATRGPSVRLQRILAMILLIAQGGITVTGSIVRVTGSGLGCDTWPNCHEFPRPRRRRRPGTPPGH